MKLPIYLDYAATCPVDERVAKKMMEYLTIDGVSVIQHLVHINLAGKLKKLLILHVIKLRI